MYDWYEDLPPEVAAPAAEPIKVRDVLDAWALVEHVFHAVLGVDLERVWRTRSFRWFQVRFRGLLLGDNPLADRFRTDPES